MSTLQFDNAMAGRFERLERKLAVLENRPALPAEFERLQIRVAQLEGELRAMKARMGKVREFG